jgi:hypothetical protein
MTDIEGSFGITPYFIAVGAAILTNYSLAWLIYKLHAPSALTGLTIALICWLGFLFVQYAAISAFSAFETNPWPLVFIDMGRPFIAFAISGLVLGAWRKREL